MDPNDAEGPTVAATPDSQPPGARLDQPAAPGYQLGKVIGAGGMGEVLLAHDPSFGRDVALKRMRAQAPTDDAIARFLREARIQARLDHPAIVPVHEQGRDADGHAVLHDEARHRGDACRRCWPRATRRCSGCSARSWMSASRSSLAHSRRVVHRDLKPANIMLGDFGEVYVLDWGVARVLDDSEGEPVSSSDIVSVDEGTRTGQLLGTPGYMAPEQMRSVPVGPAADVYALGAILFEILSGEPLHPRGQAALASTLAGHPGSPASRTPIADDSPGARRGVQRRPARGPEPTAHARATSPIGSSATSTAIATSSDVARWRPGWSSPGARRSPAALARRPCNSAAGPWPSIPTRPPPPSS